MPLNTDLNVAPYFDDYSEDKEYYRILYRPSVALQARELTQVQSMVQNQIERFGNWAFRNGDIVSGCSINDIPVLPFIRLDDFQANGASYDPTDFIGLQVVSATSNLTARVYQANNGLKANYPDTSILYVQYDNTGTGGETSFSNTDQLEVYTIPAGASPVAVVNAYPNSTASTLSTGNAHGISVSDGVVFINGTFVKVLQTSYGVVNTYGTYAGNNVVGFQLSETIVTDNQDTSLLDNALGYPNENAPGAHRLKLSPYLVSLDPDTAANTSGFNAIASYNYGGLIVKETPSSNLYSIVGNAIAQRIYDEAGNYVVNPFTVDTVTAGTGTSVISSMDANTVLGRINPGVGYAQGQRVELLKTAYINMRRGVDTKSFNAQQITFSYGGYFICNELAGTFPFASAQTVNLYDTPQLAVTNRSYAGLTPAGNVIGTAQVRNVNFVSGIPGTNTASYYVHVFNMKMSGNYLANQIKSIGYTSGSKGFADVISSGTVSNDVKEQLYGFGYSGMKNLRDSSGNINTQYVYRTNKTGTMSTSGNVTITLSGSSSGGSDQLPYGITSALPASDGINFTLIATANVDTSALGGTINVSSTSTNVGGNGTTFINDFAPGDLIKTGSTIRTVSSVTNNTLLTVDAVWGSSLTSQTYYKSYLNGRVIPWQYSPSGFTTGYVTISNTTSFTINTTQAPSSTLAVDVYYNVLRSNTSPATKVINKNRFVKINVGTNDAGPNGPWCLGVCDAHKLTAVYGSADGSYSTSGVNITSQFVFDSGQKDTHYDLAYLIPQSSYSSTSYPYLLVQLDYFTANTSAGVGFFTVESYPIDDANTSNTTAIQTKDIPLYIDDTGRKVWLRDHVDFRPFATATANNTGVANTSNATQVTTAISYATVNPSSTLTVTVPSGGLNVPAYGQNFQADYTIYLPRRDLITMTPDNKIKVIEGLSSVSPQTPLFPDNSMAVAVLSIPPYPSLSSDQIDSDRAVNQTSKNLIRDTSTAISARLVTNRRYTMSDIGKLDRRISDLEYYAQLSLVQQKAVNMNVTDENGLSRFKNGIFADGFDDDKYADVSNPEHRICIDSKNSIARPFFISEMFRFNFNSTLSGSSVQKSGRTITLPYTETSFISQPFATRYRSAAHVSSHWSGTLTLYPPFDNNVDKNQVSQAATITVDNTKPWVDYANSPMGQIWGQTVTTTDVVSNTVTEGAQNVIGGRTFDVNLGYQGTYGQMVNALNAATASYTNQGFIIGGTSWAFTGDHGAVGSNASITQIS